MVQLDRDALPLRIGKTDYVVFWEYDPRSRQGYVNLPGKADEWYRLNVSTIFHGVEGKWFRAWNRWDNMAGTLIAGAKAVDSNR
jgi:hypothetical protein